jgi:hypothetical protein
LHGNGGCHLHFASLFHLPGVSELQKHVTASSFGSRKNLHRSKRTNANKTPARLKSEQRGAEHHLLIAVGRHQVFLADKYHHVA